jgi:hypothetical protein
VGSLSSREGGKHILAATHLVGRGDHAQLVVLHARVSRDHARISWMGSAWTIRDLASRNGTFVDGERLTPGVDFPLRRGATIGFGVTDGDDVWTLADDSAPAAGARDVATGEVVSASAQMLALPSDEAPELVIVRSDDVWEIDNESGRRLVNGDRVVAAGRTFELILPEAVPQTEVGPQAGLVDAELIFRVARDEEFVELDVARKQDVFRVAPRSFHYLLATLARIRLTDRDSGHAGSEEGWVHMDDLRDKLRSDSSRINLDIFRARRQFADLGFRDATALVERRRGLGTVRLGVKKVRVSVLA